MNELINEVRTDNEVVIPTLSFDDSFVLIKFEDEEEMGVTLVGVSAEEAYEALLGLAMALRG